ncbi:hypothetical protein GF342_02315 [Candidatus Woesearchaeota archaeon]|nr:hypothetical protein [Candidatus Woesearchaeota archaeon]
MANIILDFYTWVNSYIVSVGGYLLYALIAVGFIFWGRYVFAFLEHLYASVFQKHYHRRAPRILKKAPHFDSFLVFLVGALILVPIIRGIVEFLIQPILRTTSLLVFMIFAFILYYWYYITYYRRTL